MARWTIMLSVITGLMGMIVPMSFSQTPDRETPGEETVCDDLGGAAFGLCNAYCEAMDCDSDEPMASEAACEKVLERYQSVTSTPIPCEVAMCPEACVDGIADFMAELQASTKVISLDLECSNESDTSIGYILYRAKVLNVPPPPINYVAEIMDGNCFAESHPLFRNDTTFVDMGLTAAEQTACAMEFAQDFADLTNTECVVSP